MGVVSDGLHNLPLSNLARRTLAGPRSPQMQLAAIIVSLVLTVVGVALLARAIGQFVQYFKLGQPVPAGTRTDNPYARSVTLVREFLGQRCRSRSGRHGRGGRGARCPVS